jgi:hypothetical protein
LDFIYYTKWTSYWAGGTFWFNAVNSLSNIIDVRRALGDSQTPSSNPIGGKTNEKMKEKEQPQTLVEIFEVAAKGADIRPATHRLLTPDGRQEAVEDMV